MSSYLQDSLTDALGLGKVLKASGNAIINDWSPNSIKALIIAKNYILVVKHLGVSVGCVKRFDLDINRVTEDLENIARTNYGKPKLNSLLMKRSFSCLEEIYIDTLYMNYPTVLNLSEYVREMVNSTSRLRYFGYGDMPLSGLDIYLNRSYQENAKNLDYAIGTDEKLPFKLNVRGTGNGKWYHNYLLRPNYYKLDADKGNLSIHFRKLENDYQDYIRGKELEVSKSSMEDMVSQIAEVDKSNEAILRRVDSMLQVLSKNSKDKVCKSVFDSWRKVLGAKKQFTGLKGNWLDVACGGNDYIRLCYNRYGIAYKGTNDISKEEISKELEKGRGFIDIYGMLDDLCVDVAKELLKDGKRDMVGIALTVNADTMPKGEFRRAYMKDDKGNNDIEGFFYFIGDIIGYVI